jgi:predicted nuclease of predicted toxin-antitoxin system
MKVLIDMNLSHTWVPFLTDGDHEAHHWSSVGKPQAKDQDIVDWAREHGFIVMTNDLDFARIAALSRQKRPSIVLLRGQPLLPANRGAGLLRALSQCKQELEAGAIVTLDWSDGFRVRLLPPLG